MTAHLTVVAAAVPAFVLVPYLLDVRVMAALFLAAAVSAFPDRPARPVWPGSARVGDSLLLRRSGRFGARGGRLALPRG
jgi:hypothetical protein